MNAFQVTFTNMDHLFLVRYGLDCSCDVTGAARWYGIAAAKGHAPSMHALALLYEKGSAAPSVTSSLQSDGQSFATLDFDDGYENSPASPRAAAVLAATSLPPIASPVRAYHDERDEQCDDVHARLESDDITGNANTASSSPLQWHGWPGGESVDVTPPTVGSVRVSVSWVRPTPHVR